MPPSGRLTAGLSVVPLATTWGLQGLEGPVRGILDFVSNMYLVNTLVTGQWNVFWDAVRHLILPAVAVGTIPLAIIARMTRSSLLEVLGLDYIRTARAKGLRERFVVVRHGLRNAMLPVVTVIGLSLGAFLSGAVLTETIFNLAGIGRTIVEAITGRDYIVIQGVTIVIAIGYLLVNLIVDVSYAFLDPRIRLS
jgi:peptide/nickel transport system permease protein